MYLIIVFYATREKSGLFRISDMHEGFSRARHSSGAYYWSSVLRTIFFATSASKSGLEDDDGRIGYVYIHKNKKIPAMLLNNELIDEAIAEQSEAIHEI